MQATETPTPIQSRLERIRERRDTPRPLYPPKPTPMAPFVRMARAGTLRPTLINGSWTPTNEGGAA